ncbi:MAG: hypothetical protein IKJ26_05230 [Clostridia bacterium]|nr:hypothetical protein [Clostridia bacterium]
MKKCFARAALCALTFGALAVHAAPAVRTPVLPDGAVWALALFALWMLYGALFKLKKPFVPKRLWVLAALFSGVMTLGESFAAAGTAEWVTGQLPAAALFFAGRVPLYFALMRLFVHVLSLPGRTMKRLPVPMMSGALLLCWLPWYVCLFPGTVSNDSVSQLKIILGLSPWSNANPICQTGLVGLFRQIGIWLGGGADLAVALYCIVQAVLMAWLLGELLCEMAKASAPRALVWGNFAFYAFCPVFPVFAFCVGKDTNFAMAVLFLALEVWRVTHSDRIRPVRIVCMCIASAACVLLRNPGIYVVILTLAFLLVWSIRRKVWIVPLSGLVCASAVFAILHLAVIPTLDIAPMPETEEYSIPLQQIARVAAANALTPEQTAALEGVLPVDELKAAYNGELSDPVKDLWYADATEEQKAAFWPAWLSVLRSNPITCVSATFHNTYGYLYPGYVSTIKPTLIIGNHSSRTANVAGYFDYTVNPLSTRLKAFTEALNTNALYRIVISPGLYGWLTLLAAAWLMRGRDRRSLLCAVPALFTLAGCMLSAVNGYFRYAMPLYLSAPLLIWLMQQHKAEQ